MGESDEVVTGEHTDEELVATDGDLECRVETSRVCCCGCDWTEEDWWDVWGGGDEVCSWSGSSSCSGEDEDTFCFLELSTQIDDDDEPLDEDDPNPSYFRLLDACLNRLKAAAAISLFVPTNGCEQFGIMQVRAACTNGLLRWALRSGWCWWAAARSDDDDEENDDDVDDDGDDVLLLIELCTIDDGRLEASFLAGGSSELLWWTCCCGCTTWPCCIWFFFWAFSLFCFRHFARRFLNHTFFKN